jgi:hypothetical protein
MTGSDCGSVFTPRAADRATVLAAGSQAEGQVMRLLPHSCRGTWLFAGAGRRSYPKTRNRRRCYVCGQPYHLVQLAAFSLSGKFLVKTAK